VGIENFLRDRLGLTQIKKAFEPVVARWYLTECLTKIDPNFSSMSVEDAFSQLDEK
jgi:hypothetical protein